VSRAPSDRARRLAELERELRTMGARSVMLSHTIASRLGIAPADLETMDILSTNGPLMAGRLAELTGLTTGAITGVVDRLERSGFVRRERDANDRRRVIVHLVADRARRIGKLFAPLARAMAELSERYTDEVLALMADYARRGNAITLDHIALVERGGPGRGRG
jgi:DNA-binding MarR family transcriptional regulator